MYHVRKILRQLKALGETLKNEQKVKLLVIARKVEVALFRYEGG